LNKKIILIYICLSALIYGNNARASSLSSSGSVNGKGEQSVYNFEAILGYPKTANNALSIDYSISSFHKGLLSHIDNIYIYSKQTNSINVDAMTQEGLDSIANALESIKYLSNNDQAIEYISPSFSISYKFRNLGFAVVKKNYNYIYVSSSRKLNSSIFKDDSLYSSKKEAYTAYKKIYNDYIDSFMNLNEKHISTTSYYMSYANKIMLSGFHMFYGLSLKLISAEYMHNKLKGESVYSYNYIYSQSRKFNSNKSSSKISYNFSFIMKPSKNDNIMVGIAFKDLNSPTFGEFTIHKSIILSVSLSASKEIKLYLESDLISKKDIYNHLEGEKTSVGVEYFRNELTFRMGLENNTNILRNGRMSIGIGANILNGYLDIGYSTLNNFESFKDGKLKDSGEVSFSYSLFL